MPSKKEMYLVSLWLTCNHKTWLKSQGPVREKGRLRLTIIIKAIISLRKYLFTVIYTIYIKTSIYRKGTNLGHYENYFIPNFWHLSIRI